MCRIELLTCTSYRIVQSRKKKADRSAGEIARGSKAALTVVRELIPFHTFNIYVQWTAPRVASDEWNKFFRAQYAIDLWRVDPVMRQEICELALRYVRLTALAVAASTSAKLSNSMTPDGWFMTPPDIPPSWLELDDADKAHIQQIESILCMPHVRLVLPYLAWHGNRLSHTDVSLFQLIHF